MVLITRIIDSKETIPFLYCCASEGNISSEFCICTGEKDYSSALWLIYMRHINDTYCDCDF